MPNAEKWDAGAGRTETPAYGLTVQVDVTAIYLSANVGRRFFWAIRERVTPPEGRHFMSGATFVMCPRCGRLMLGQLGPDGVAYPQPHTCVTSSGSGAEWAVEQRSHVRISNSSSNVLPL